MGYTSTALTFIWNWVKTLRLSDFYIFVGSISVIAAWFIGVSSILWAFDGWGLISLDWTDGIIELFKNIAYDILSLEFIAGPLEGVKNVLGALASDRRFDTDNDGFIVMFIWFVYPLLWNMTIPAAIVNVLVLPIYAVLYIIDNEIFVDYEATKLQNGVNYPEEGFPTLFAKSYNIHSLLWGNYKFLEDPTYLRMDLTQILFLFWFSIVQLFMSTLLEPILWVWGILSTFSMSAIIFYEIFFLNLSFYDEEVVIDGATSTTEL
jgi:hypothetical protein